MLSGTKLKLAEVMVAWQKVTAQIIGSRNFVFSLFFSVSGQTLPDSDAGRASLQTPTAVWRAQNQSHVNVRFNTE